MIFDSDEFKEKIINTILEDRACPLCTGTNLIFGKDLYPPSENEYNFYCLQKDCNFRGQYKELAQKQ